MRVLVLICLFVAAGAPPAGGATHGAWSPLVDVSAPGQHAGLPQLVVAPDGTATAVWYRSNGTHDVIQTASRTPGGAWGSAVDLSASGQSAGSPQVVLAADGTATAVWGSGIAIGSVIRAATSPAWRRVGPVDRRLRRRAERDPPTGRGHG